MLGLKQARIVIFLQNFLNFHRSSCQYTHFLSDEIIHLGIIICRYSGILIFSRGNAMGPRLLHFLFKLRAAFPRCVSLPPGVFKCVDWQTTKMKRLDFYRAYDTWGTWDAVMKLGRREEEKAYNERKEEDWKERMTVLQDDWRTDELGIMYW